MCRATNSGTTRASPARRATVDESRGILVDHDRELTIIGQFDLRISDFGFSVHKRMSHDYHLPPEWPAMDAEERHEWMVHERALRQALRQDTTWARVARHQAERAERRAAARSETVDVANPDF